MDFGIEHLSICWGVLSRRIYKDGITWLSIPPILFDFGCISGLLHCGWPGKTWCNLLDCILITQYRREIEAINLSLISKYLDYYLHSSHWPTSVALVLVLLLVYSYLCFCALFADPSRTFIVDSHQFAIHYAYIIFAYFLWFGSRLGWGLCLGFLSFGAWC